jgi:hypothetical protein
MTPPLPSPGPASNRLRADQASGPQHVLTDSTPDPPAAAAPPRVQMAPTAAPRDLAYTRALAAASQRMWAAPDVAALWRIVVDEAVALIGAEAATVVTHTERFWQTLAAHPSDATADESATAAVIEMLIRQGLPRQPISIDDPAEGASWMWWADARYSSCGLRVAPDSRSVWCGMPPARPLSRGMPM